MSLSPEARECLLANPDLFLAEYFPHRVEKLEPFHLELIRTDQTETRGLILFPAGHGKTTIVSELLPIYDICKNANVRLANIAKNEADAQAITRSIQSELVQNTRLIQDFGPFRPEGEGTAWSLTRFDVQGRTRRGKSSTFAAFGAGGRGALGYRTDKTRCDDVVTDVNSSTPEARAKLREWFNQGPETMGDSPSSALLVVGTLFHPEDLYHDLMEAILPDGQSMYTTAKYSAIVDWETQQVLWPEYRPWLWLMQRKLLMGTLDFNKRFQNIAVDPSTQVVKHEYIYGGYVGKVKYPGCLERGYVIGDVPSEWRKVAGFDPAGGKTRGSKFCAHLTLAIGSCAEHERCYWVVDLVRDQMTLPQMVNLILEQHERYDLDHSMIEANSLQIGIAEAAQAKMAERGAHYSIEPHYTTRTNKPDPVLGVQRMSPWFENGEVHIPWGNPESQRKMQPFIDELITYPGRTTDTVMAMWFAWKKLQETARKYQSFNRLLRDPKKQFWGGRPMSGRMVRNPYYAKEAEA
jgi:phage terminase large subunit-like protein